MSLQVSMLGTVWNNLLDMLMKTNVIIALVLAIVGVAIAILAKRIARSIRKTRDIAPNDKYMIALKIVGLVLILIALVLLIINP